MKLRHPTLSYLLVFVFINTVGYIKGSEDYDENANMNAGDGSYNDQDTEFVPMFYAKEDAKLPKKESKSVPKKTKKLKDVAKPTARITDPAKTTPVSQATKPTAATTTGAKAAKETTKAAVTATPTAKATTKGGPIPTKKAAAKVTTKAAAQVTTKAAAKPTTKAAAKPTTKAAAQPTTKAAAQPTTKAVAQPTAKPAAKVTPQATVKPTIKPAVQAAINGGAGKAADEECQNRWPWLGLVLSMTECEIKFCNEVGKVEVFSNKATVQGCAELRHGVLESACPVRGKLYFHNHVIKRNPCAIEICSEGLPRLLAKKKCKTNKDYKYL